jgi:hypothetical protein
LVGLFDADQPIPAAKPPGSGFPDFLTVLNLAFQGACITTGKLPLMPPSAGAAVLESQYPESEQIAADGQFVEPVVVPLRAMGFEPDAEQVLHQAADPACFA